MKSEITIQEFKDVLNYIIDNNKKLTAKGKPKVVIEALGVHGLGKTESIIQVAEERNMRVVKINLAQIEELGDFVGIPVKEYKVIDDKGSEVWVDDKVLDAYLKAGYSLSSVTESRMSYAIPSWVPKDDEEIILLLDDFRRADYRYMQALMELISKGEYISWKLPENTHVVLSSNPDTGDYNVTSLDPAQRNRFISFTTKFDLNTWAKWAEEEKVESRVINFALFYPEIFDNPNDSGITPRSVVTFANTISGISNFSDSKNLSLINIIAEGCFESKENTIGTLFTMFVNNKMDRLITPDEMVKGNWKTVAKKMEDSIYDNDEFRADISSILTTRFLNYVDIYYDSKEITSKEVNSRIIELVEHKKQLLSMDLIFMLIKKLMGKHPVRSKDLLRNKTIVDAIQGV